MKITTSVQLALAGAGAAFIVMSGSVIVAYTALRDSNEQRQQLYSVVIGNAELQIRTIEYLKDYSPRPLRQWSARNSIITEALKNLAPSAYTSSKDIAALRERQSEISQIFSSVQAYGWHGEDRMQRMQRMQLQLLIDRLFVKYEEQLGVAAELRQNTLLADQQGMRRAATFVASALACLTCIFLSLLYLVHRTLSVPLGKLVDATEVLGGGDLSYRIGPMPNNEVGALAEAVNIMATRLENLTASRTELEFAQDELRVINETLELRIAERTVELTNTHDKLRQAQKMEAIGQLTGGISHDFNNLLAGLKGNLEMMRLRINQGRVPEMERHIDSALSLTDRAAALTHRLLSFSRQQALDPRNTDVNIMAASMLPLLERTVGPHIQVLLKQESDIWPVLCDSNQLENALLNLIINSRDAMPEGGNVTIETSNTILDENTSALSEEVVSGQYVCLRVIDTGGGMAPNVVARAFDPFFTTKPIGQGTGLGLSMIHGFIKQSQGYVHIQSAPSAGTTVELYLPRFIFDSHIVDNTPAVPAAVFENFQPRTIRGAVLVVDDESVLRSLVAEMLREIGYRVLEAEDGISAMKVLQSNEELNLLVTDIGLPNGMNGRQLADVARVQRPDLKVLFITGFAENSLVDKHTLPYGMEIMTKPFPMGSFAAKVRLIVEEDLNWETRGGAVMHAHVDIQHGSMVTSPLPLVQQVDPMHALSAQPTNVSAKQLAILVVDDNEDAATILAMLLDSSGHVVQVAHDGRMGLEAATAVVPDVVFLDIGMPVMDGFETAREIRKIPALADTILVALTGWGAEHDRARSKDAGFDYHLTKPADLSAIEALLSRLDASKK